MPRAVPNAEVDDDDDDEEECGRQCAVRVVGERRLNRRRRTSFNQLYQNGNKEKCPSRLCSATAWRGSLTFTRASTCTFVSLPDELCSSMLPTFNFDCTFDSSSSSSSSLGHSRRRGGFQRLLSRGSHIALPLLFARLCAHLPLSTINRIRSRSAGGLGAIQSVHLY